MSSNDKACVKVTSCYDKGYNKKWDYKLLQLYGLRKIYDEFS